MSICFVGSWDYVSEIVCDFLASHDFLARGEKQVDQWELLLKRCPAQRDVTSACLPSYAVARSLLVKSRGLSSWYACCTLWQNVTTALTTTDLLLSSRTCRHLSSSPLFQSFAVCDHSDRFGSMSQIPRTV